MSEQIEAVPRASLLSRFLRLRRGPWENLATVLIGLGVVMLMQPFSAIAYAYSFVTILAGTLLFAIVSHFPE
ncbi:hypothetical protein C3941_08465 [Kaistia algarum]|uniref:hypothetical protein n=1 Tax=Kaistia algarum TaxID=2083279 RepID=UPI000CE8EF16|nr:hypothetical protein [Kaistia algarum]MCX5512089.1 hypothetical protein [Kaistia algarum]PPE80205.1 hypothetical protein C3941_08465 [Kaistia algarum]